MKTIKVKLIESLQKKTSIKVSELCKIGNEKTVKSLIYILKREGWKIERVSEINKKTKEKVYSYKLIKAPKKIIFTTVRYGKK